MGYGSNEFNVQSPTATRIALLVEAHIITHRFSQRVKKQFVPTVYTEALYYTGHRRQLGSSGESIYTYR
jgi:hypothetical protein